MEALFIGHAYIDVTFVADDMPQGDAKSVAKDYAVAFGGNATTAAFCCAKLGVIPDLITTNSNDWLGRMFMDMAAKYGISVHPRKVKRSSLSFIMPKDGQRAIVRARDDEYLHPFPHLNLGNCRALHLDGHLADAALYYAKAFRQLGRLVSLDGGGLRSNTDELLEYVDVAVVAERLCEQMKLSETEMLEYLKSKGCKIGGVTAGERGMLWYDENGKVQRLPALSVPKSAVVDTNGAGDIFHGAYMYSYLTRPLSRWEDHFRFARGASTHAIQYLGNEAKLPTRADVESIETRFQPVSA
jgi:sugar/nucleoside kinase (ribokinase family)